MTNPLIALRDRGQSVWYDFIHRDFLRTGGLAKLIAADGVRGVTSNPAIFKHAIAGSGAYDAALERADTGLDTKGLYELLAIEDIRAAADELRATYESTAALDGYVSLEVSPHLAHDTAGTVAEARRLWAAVERPNLMVKVPATRAGIPAIQELIAAGVNVNVTLLFSRTMYEAVAEAYATGLEHRAAAGHELERVASVASFFISRIDSAIDDLLGGDAAHLRGGAAIANAKLTYQRYKQLYAGARWSALQSRGARPQRLLWASTSTKNPDYRDVLYVEQLIGPDTVNTIPVATLDAFREHGVARDTLEAGLDEARDTLAALAQHGVDLEEVTSQLLDQGLALFVDAFDELLDAIQHKRPQRV
jgi:transaldolase/glucose-6-phosphate isomerase